MIAARFLFTINKLLKPIDNISNSFTTDKGNSFLSLFQRKIDSIYSNLSTSPAPTPSTPLPTSPLLTSQPLSHLSYVSPRGLSIIMAEMKSPTCALDSIPSGTENTEGFIRWSNCMLLTGVDRYLDDLSIIIFDNYSLCLLVIYEIWHHT